MSDKISIPAEGSGLYVLGFDAGRESCDGLRDENERLRAEIEQMRRHHDLFCRCDSVRYGYA